MSLNPEAYGTQEYFSQELKASTASRRVAAANTLARKAEENFCRQLKADYDGTLGIDASNTNDDQIMMAEVKAKCEALKSACIAAAGRNFSEVTHTTAGHQGQRVENGVALFRLATLNDTDPFLDIMVPKGICYFRIS